MHPLPAEFPPLHSTACSETSPVVDLIAEPCDPDSLSVKRPWWISRSPWEEIAPPEYDSLPWNSTLVSSAAVEVEADQPR
ncbi:MAG: hypothetical protein GY898_16740 [Proteobacteria bacterium]|nr:hypothetical protein [Pseudomonadota bacterium]